MRPTPFDAFISLCTLDRATLIAGREALFDQARQLTIEGNLELALIISRCAVLLDAIQDDRLVTAHTLEVAGRHLTPTERKDIAHYQRGEG